MFDCLSSPAQALLQAWTALSYLLWTCQQECIGFLRYKFSKNRRFRDEEARERLLGDEIGDWPRRLLHVKSMTSYEWKPGNRYGKYKCPEYNALSYTWGRYALSSGQKPLVNTLKVHGITWDIPRVDPDTHFSLLEFRHIIRQALENNIEKVRWRGYERRVDFLWLDVACIDQNFPRWATLEIGRQAAIFGRAKNVYVWLSRLSGDTLQSVIPEIIRAGEEASASWGGMQQSLVPDPGHFEHTWLRTTTDSMNTLMSDPYFTSLWTLQESYLCPGAIILSRNGSPCVGYKRLSVCLSEVSLALRKVHKQCLKIVEIGSCENDAFLDLIQKIVESGISMFAFTQPMALYGVSRYRKTTHSEDRIYGIQQIFRFQLGCTDPQSTPDRKYSLEELEEEFAEKLLVESPRYSQLFVRLDIADVGKSWCVTDKCLVPPFAHPVGYLTLPGLSHACQITKASRTLGNWCHISATACPFPSMQKAWRQYFGYTDSFMQHNIPFCQLIAMDSELRMQLTSTQVACPSPGRVQHDVAEEIASLAVKDDIRVIFLDGIETMDYQNPEPYAYSYYYGIIVCMRKAENEALHWHRLGICQWPIVAEYYDHPMVPLLRGLSDDWKNIEGFTVRRYCIDVASMTTQNKYVPASFMMHLVWK